MDANRIGEAAAGLAYATKLAEDMGTDVTEVRRLAASASLPVCDFVKRAYADVDGFIEFLRRGREKRANQGVQGVMSRLRAALSGAGSTAQNIVANARPSAPVGDAASMAFDPTKNPLLAKLFNRSKAGHGLTQAVEKYSPAGGSMAGRASTMAAPPVLMGTGYAAMSGGTPPAQPAPEPAPAPSKADLGSARPGPAAGEQPGGAKPPGDVPGTAKAEPKIPANQGSTTSPAGNLSPTAKGLLGIGAAGAAGMGAYALAKRNKGKKKPTKEASARSPLAAAVIKVAADKIREKTRAEFCRYIDKAAASLDLPAQLPLRTIQREIAAGSPLGVAVKVAFPRMPAEERGIFAMRLVEAAAL